MKLIQIIFLALALTSALVGNCYCNKIVIQAAKTAVIMSPSNAGDVRSLLYFELPRGLSSQKVCIDFAILSCRARVIDATLGQIDVFPITSKWKSVTEVSWSGPWKNPGGDYSTDIQQGLYSLKSEASMKEIAIDITKIVEAWFKGELENNGLMIKLSQDDLANYRAIKPSVDAQNVRLTLFYSLTD